MRKILVVYNTCGISGKDNTNYYIKCLDSFLSQNFDDFEVAVSSCLNPPDQQQKLVGVFGDSLHYNFINEKLPVNVTFNDTVRQCVNRLGNFEGYLYIDSGCHFGNDLDTLLKMYELYKSGPYGIVSALASNDNGTESVFGFSAPIRENFLIPVGKAINGHVQIFSNEIFERFGRIIPDVFATFCTESVYSFLAACCSQQWVVIKDLVIPHEKSIDGASAGFAHIPPNGAPIWDNTFCSKRSMREIISDVEGIRAGFGYEECNRILMHDPSCFDETGFAKYPEELTKFMVDNIFVSPPHFSYENIKRVFI